MNIFKIAARVATRSDTLSMIERIFNEHNIYPPFMRQTPGAQTYEGEIEKGFKLEVTDVDVDPTMLPKLNGAAYENFDKLIDDFKLMKSMGGSFKFTPHGGSVGGMEYEISEYSYDGEKQEEILSIVMHFSDPSLAKATVSVVTTMSGAKFTSLVLEGKAFDGTQYNKNFAKEANNQEWPHVGMETVTGFDPVTRLFEPASKAVEHAAWSKLRPFMEKNGIVEGSFFDWVRANSHSVVDGTLKLKKRL